MALVRAYGLAEDDAEAAIGSDAFGALGAELRRAVADGYDVKRLLPGLLWRREGSATRTTSLRYSTSGWLARRHARAAQAASEGRCRSSQGS